MGKLAGTDGVIDRSQDARHSVGPSGRLKAAVLFGTRVADPILASGHLRLRQQAGHMIASDPIARTYKALATEGPSTYGSPPLRRGSGDERKQAAIQPQLISLWRPDRAGAPAKEQPLHRPC